MNPHLWSIAGTGTGRRPVSAQSAGRRSGRDSLPSPTPTCRRLRSGDPGGQEILLQMRYPTDPGSRSVAVLSLLCVGCGERRSRPTRSSAAPAARASSGRQGRGETATLAPPPMPPPTADPPPEPVPLEASHRLRAPRVGTRCAPPQPDRGPCIWSPGSRCGAVV